jgi:hypothetical protein
MPQFSGIFTTTQHSQARGANTWPAPPGPPTIGTATATAATTATVAFTAPAYVGYPATGITGYTVTSSPGGITATGSTSPITVTGLSGSTSYTFRVTATNATGIGSASAASNSITTPSAGPTVIGQAYQGGFYAGQISTTGNSVATHYLLVGPVASAQSLPYSWQYDTTNTPGTSSVIDGPANSAAMNDANHPPAQFCEGLTIGGYTDWYMPANNELQVCYVNLKPSTTANTTGRGTNPNAVPARASNYTSGDPAQTTAAAFISGGAEAFETGTRYWTSTQSSTTSRASYLRFANGYLDTSSKTNTSLVRAIRRIPV